MKVNSRFGPGIAANSLGILLFAIALTTAFNLCVDAQDETPAPAPEVKARDARSNVDEARVDLAVARDRAIQMLDIYSTTLDVIHRRYFHGDRATVPARAMEDIFSDIKRRSKVEARWIAVNTKAMSIDHDPKSDFEVRAAKEIADGKTEIEVVEDGYYRRAAPISLHDGCLRCHEGLFQSQSKKPRFAGLVVSIPIHVDSSKAQQ